MLYLKVVPKLNQKGFIAQLLLFLILLAGVGVGIYLVQTKTSLFSKAAPVIPDKPETSFELEAQADTSPMFTDAAALKNVSVGQKFRVDIWVRSDIDPANLFVAKLKYPADLLQVVEIEKRDANSFINQWIAEPSFDNSSGDISIIGGVNAPGLLTSSQDSGSVKGIDSAPTALVSGEYGQRTIRVGQSFPFRADLFGTARSAQIWITKSPDGKTDFSCSSGIVTNSAGEKWCMVGDGAGSIVSKSFIMQEEGEYIVAVNAFTNEEATFTGDPATQCSGNPLPSGYADSSKWSYCGESSNFKLTVIPPKTETVSAVTPAISFSANPSTITKGQSVALSWTSSNAVKCTLNPPGIYKTVDTSGSDSFSPTASTTYDIRCEGSGGAANSVTASTTVTVNEKPTPEEPQPVSGGEQAKVSEPAAPTQPTLKASRLMVSIIFEAKKTGTANIEFADNAEILRNSDGINILSAQKGLKLEITPITVSQNAVLSLDPPKSTVNRGCSFPVNINLDTAGIQAEGADAVLSYDPAKFTVQEISKGQIFADYPITDIDSNAGKVAISAISMINAPFEGKGTLATLQFKVKDYAAVGSTTVNFDFDSSNKDKVTDSNVSTVQNGVVTDALGSVTNANYTVGTGICTSQSATLPILECTGITADAQLGKFKEENVYIVKASDRVKVTANVIPLPATVSWQTTVDGKNLTSDPKNGFTFDTGDRDHVSGLYTVYNNTTDSDLVEILEATTKQGSAQATCKRLKFLVQPAGKQISIPVSAKPMQVGETKTFRHDGDINGDSKINLVDMSRLLAQIGQATQSEADLNGDGQINSMDVLSMRNILIKNGSFKI